MSMISHILIVDDDTALLEALPETIHSRMANVSVDIAESGRKALALIADVDYDAIVTDIKMPELDGLGLLERVRELRPDTPTLLITGHGERDLAIRAIRGGAYDFIEKPIDRDHFIASLYRAIQARRLKRQVDEQSQALARHADELEQMVQERTRELVEANGAKDEFLRARDHALAVAGRAQERLAFLAEATRILVTSLDPTDTLSRLARFVVPTLADYCVISLTLRGGVSRRVAMMHADPECMDTLAQSGGPHCSRQSFRRASYPEDSRGGSSGVVSRPRACRHGSGRGLFRGPSGPGRGVGCDRATGRPWTLARSHDACANTVRRGISSRGRRPRGRAGATSRFGGGERPAV